MKRIIRIIIFSLVLALLPASALAYGWHVDTDAMKAIEAADTFEVRVVEKVVTDGVNASFSSLDDNKDILSLTLQNSLDAAVVSVTVCIVAYDESANTAALTSEMAISSLGGDHYREISVLTFDVDDFAAGSSTVLNIPCHHANFTGARALVARYVDASGAVYTNPVLEEWYEQAMGCPTHILD